MLVDLSDDQSLLVSSLDRLTERFRQPPHGAEHSYVQYSEALERALRDSGFGDVARSEGYGAIDAAILVERIGQLPFSVEFAASALIGPLLGHDLRGPLAICEGLGRPTRFLPQARHVCLIFPDKVLFADLDAADVRPVDGVIAYPLGVLARVPDGAAELDPATGRSLSVMWRVAIAAEAAGLMRGALDLTVGFVKERMQFKRALGDFQAVQHRLAICEQIVSASRLLAMRAAYTGESKDAAVALLFAQKNMRTVIYDCHQFHGAMGLTLEYPLHLWTYRLKYIQGEMGGYTGNAAHLSDLLWAK